MPYLYIGSAALMLALCYFLGTDSTRAKFVSAALTVGVAASYLLDLPGISWQNGDDLAVFPFRYGFLLSAMLVIFAADTLVHQSPPVPALGAGLFLAAIYLLGYRGTVGSAGTNLAAGRRGRAVSGLLRFAAAAGPARLAAPGCLAVVCSAAGRCGGQQLYLVVRRIFMAVSETDQTAAGGPSQRDRIPPRPDAGD